MKILPLNRCALLFILLIIPFILAVNPKDIGPSKFESVTTGWKGWWNQQFNHVSSKVLRPILQEKLNQVYTEQRAVVITGLPIFVKTVFLGIRQEGASLSFSDRMIYYTFIGELEPLSAELSRQLEGEFDTLAMESIQRIKDAAIIGFNRFFHFKQLKAGGRGENIQGTNSDASFSSSTNVQSNSNTESVPSTEATRPQLTVKELYEKKIDGLVRSIVRETNSEVHECLKSFIDALYIHLPTQLNTAINKYLPERYRLQPGPNHLRDTSARAKNWKSLWGLQYLLEDAEDSLNNVLRSRVQQRLEELELEVQTLVADAVESALKTFDPFKLRNIYIVLKNRGSQIPVIPAAKKFVPSEIKVVSGTYFITGWIASAETGMVSAWDRGTQITLRGSALHSRYVTYFVLLMVLFVASTSAINPQDIPPSRFESKTTGLRGWLNKQIDAHSGKYLRPVLRERLTEAYIQQHESIFGDFAGFLQKTILGIENAKEDLNAKEQIALVLFLNHLNNFSGDLERVLNEQLETVVKGSIESIGDAAVRGYSRFFHFKQLKSLEQQGTPVETTRDVEEPTQSGIIGGNSKSWSETKKEKMVRSIVRETNEAVHRSFRQSFSTIASHLPRKLNKGLNKYLPADYKVELGPSSSRTPNELKNLLEKAEDYINEGLNHRIERGLSQLQLRFQTVVADAVEDAVYGGSRRPVNN
ncbi:hypothetical protein BKA69DRAFT_1123928 [Paraphysoderma sedebokerense]|nr:hypothetical protein BKA69DRAFT_1123928 [Paraphysoderma sedebokerense]